MSKKQFVGKNVEKAIENGLEELGLKQEDVDIKIIDQGGLFRKAKVEIIFDGEEEIVEEETVSKKDEKELKKAEKKAEKEAKKSAKLEEKSSKKSQEKEEIKEEKNQASTKEDLIELCKNFLDGLFKNMQVDAEISVVEKENNITFCANGEMVNRLIGKRGDTMNAIQEILSIVARNSGNREYRVYFDVENYKERREETLVALAKRTASKVVKIGKPIKLDNMSAYERKIIHTALQEFDGVTTKSEGEEPNRHLVVIPTKD